MYAFNRHLHPTTGIEHSLWCNFFSSHEKNLVIAGINQLHVYRLNADVETTSKLQDKSLDGKSKKKKLECVGSFTLFGNIMSMQSVRLAGAPRDSLLLSLRIAKLSLVDYDPSTHDLKTSSLHYFEEDEMKDGHIQQGPHIPIVRVDPEGRCASMLIYGNKLVILPFRRDSGSEDPDPLLMGQPSSKTPIMSSYIIDLRKLDEKITNVLDIQFLHGYYEPTVFILYEPLPTWTGRVAVRRDTCSIVAISLNIQERVHPIIWSHSGLPHDCMQSIPIPKPIGGVLVFAFNSLIYLNQSVPPYGVSLNSLTTFSTEFILKIQEGVKITLDCAQATLISHDKLVLSLRGGELYVLTLVVDGMRAVRSFHFDKAAASVLTTCMNICDDGYLFLGSRLGNSLLLKYTEKSSEDPYASDSLSKKETEEPPTKKKKSDNMASDVSRVADLEELEVYGSEAQTGVQITSYMFEVCDSILNIGPCGVIVMGEPAFLSEEFSSTIDPDLELVSTSGYGKNGALSVLQRSVRPQVVTTFELPGCQDMWTVIGPPTKVSEEDKKSDEETIKDGHALLILSREDSSMVLQTGQEIMELDHSGFSTQGPTVFASNVGGNKYIIQVTQMGVRLMEGVEQIQHMPIDMGSPIACCSVADPYVIIMTEEGTIMMLTVREDSFGSAPPRLHVARPQIPKVGKVLTICGYKDVSGLFSLMGKEDTESEKQVEKPSPQVPDRLSFSFDKGDVDDEDELLYGDSGPSLFTSPTTADKDKPKDSVEEKKKEIKQTYWIVLARDTGKLEIYSLPDFKLCFLVKNFPVGHKVLLDAGQISETMQSDKSINDDFPPVRELLLVGLGHKCSRPHLMARIDEEVYIYEAFSYNQGMPEGHLKLRFKKIQHNMMLRSRKINKKKNKDKEGSPEEKELTLADRVRWLRPFSDISGYSGVFVSGPYPHWLFMSQRGILRVHPMSIDGQVTCFAPFHNINCPHGFLYFNRLGELRISVLPTHLSYDAPWPLRKVPLRCTPHQVAYHPDSKTYGVVTSVSESCNKFINVQGDGERDYETIEKDERFVYPTIEKFSIQLFSPVSWEPIPNTKYELDEFEHVTCMKHVMLKSEGTVSGMKGYIVVGTANTFGEEVTSRGRLVIFDVIEVVPEPGQPLTKNKMKIEYDKEQKGPITAVEHVEGFLVTSIGQKIYIWTLKNQDLSGVAFIDTQICICSMASIKNLILVGDILKSVSLLRYQEDMKVLSFVSRDTKLVEVYSLAFMVDNTNLSFLCSDRDKNVLAFTYQPETRESQGGQRLLRRADINVGSHINCFFRLRCKLTDPSTDKVLSGPIEHRHINFYATLDGSMGFLLPISEKMYRRLLMLQNALTVHMPHYAGLNPRAYRLITSEHKILQNPHRNILDGDLLWKYLHLSILEKRELARRIGTSVDQIYEDLLEVDRTTAHF